jgi:O-methyltransferase
MPGPQEPDHEFAALDLLLRGFQVSRMLRLVADLGVTDRIPPDGRVAVGDLARDCGVQSRPLMRVLQALAAFGVFAVAADGGVAHTARSRLLRTDAPKSLHHAARFWTAPGSWRAWERLGVALTGGVPHETAWGMSRFEYLRAHPDEARIFDAMMAHFPDNRHTAVAATYDFSGARLIADIGGGNGALLRHILARFPEPRGAGARPGGRGPRYPARRADGGADRGGGGQLLRGRPRRSGHLAADPGAARLARRGLPTHPARLPCSEAAGGAAAHRRAGPRPRPSARPADQLPA